MRSTSKLATALCLMAAPAMADDNDYGAYLFKGSCSAWEPGSVVEDVGDLDAEDDASKDWARMSPDGASAPSPIHVEDESVDGITPDQIASGGYAVAVTDADDRNAALIACGEIPEAADIPFAGNLNEVNGSGIAGRIAIEAHDGGIKITTAAYNKDAAPALGQ